ncbi:protein kinase superfamily protein, partial [Striga asiatica]
MLGILGENKLVLCFRNIRFPVKKNRGLKLSLGMGCICSKIAKDENEVKKKEKASKGSSKSSVRKEDVVVEADSKGNEATAKLIKQKMPRKAWGPQPQICRVLSMKNGVDGSQVVAGWPSWLTSVAGEAIKGWIPRKADSFEKLDKIGQGTYSSVYRARDLETGKIVALKKVRFVNMDPESVRFMAREILILRRLDHPNVMKLQGLVTSRVSGNLYLVFEYMEHDLAGLSASPLVRFTESQIKCFMQQLLRGLEHCHNRGVLHRDIKGSNLLIDGHGNLKIGDFWLATFFRANQKQALTSRVVTLWYRPPELLLGSTDYGVAVDLWSSEYWKKSKLLHATIFKPQQPYKRCVAETFKDFPPLALSLLESLLAFEPELRGSTTSALHSESAAGGKRGRVESSRKVSKAIPAPDANAELPASVQKRKGQPNPKSNSEIDSSGYRDLKTQRSFKPQGTALPEAAHSLISAEIRVFMQTCEIHMNGWKMLEQSNNLLGKAESTCKINGQAPNLKEANMVYAFKKTRMHYSGPLLPPGGSVEEMLKEHEKQIQLAVRKARDKSKSRLGQLDNGHIDTLLGY